MKVKYKDVLLYKIVRPIISFLFKIIFTPKILGAENIPQEGKVILAGNHTHIFDCLMLISSTKRNIHFLAKEELWHGPKKIIFANMGLIPVNRKIHDKDSLIHAKNYLKNNLVIGIFPEGTTEKEKGKVMDFKIGAVKMAKDTDTPIIPFIIKGKYHLFSKDLQIKFLKPTNVKGNDLTKENLKLKNIIKNELEEN